jgi:hypothetical protein
MQGETPDPPLGSGIAALSCNPTTPDVEKSCCKNRASRRHSTCGKDMDRPSIPAYNACIPFIVDVADGRPGKAARRKRDIA